MKIIIEIDSHKIATARHTADIGNEIRNVLCNLLVDVSAAENSGGHHRHDRYAALTAALVKGIELKDDEGYACGSCKGEGDFL